MLNRPLKWIGGSLLVLIIIVLVLLNLSNWNWLRGPISRTVADKTGRELVIGGDLIVKLGWPRTSIRTERLSFSNPTWSKTKQMVVVNKISFQLNVPRLLKREIILSEVLLNGANISLEKSIDGRKNWLLDRNQRDEKSRVVIDSLAMSDGKVRFLDPANKTDIHASISTPIKAVNSQSALVFAANGKFRGQTLKADGTGGGLLALRDVRSPYPLEFTASLGPTSLRAKGRITNLLKFSAMDLKIDLRGGSLAELYPALGVVLPDTPPYRTQGRLIREAKTWRYQNFSGQIGKSDIAGTLTVDTGAKRPYLTGALVSKKLSFADLGPLVGAKQSNAAAVKAGVGRVLPDTPFRTERWNKMDADVTIKAHSIVRGEALPISDLSTRMRLHNAVLTLDPLKFGVAGGTLAGSIKLDGHANTLKGMVDLKARQIRIAQLVPKLESAKTSIGLINGDVDLKGSGGTVAKLLGSADGRFAMVMNKGEISKLMMEAVGLHILEMLQLKLTGDKNIQIHCGVADFDVKNGVMRSNVVMLDTDITRINATGTVDLRSEVMDLTIVQKSKKLSLIALRPPIHVRGPFAKPDVSLDKGKLAARGLGAVALAIVNPILAIVPLVETGKDKDSDCARLIQDTKKPAKRATSKG